MAEAARCLRMDGGAARRRWGVGTAARRRRVAAEQVGVARCAAGHALRHAAAARKSTRRPRAGAPGRRR